MPKQNDLPTPVTVNQRFLAKAAGMDVELPTAITMDQMYLQEIAEGGGSVEKLKDVAIENPENGEVLKYDAEQEKWVNGTVSGGGGTSDYTDLTNKPKINGVTLAGNKSLSEIGAADASETYTDAEVDGLLAEKADADDVYTKAQTDIELAKKVDKVAGKGLSTNDYTTSEKTKLNGIESGANVNVQSDWNQTTTTADDYIKNKPTIPDAQIQSDWNQTNTESKDFIKNKPTLGSAASKNYTTSVASGLNQLVTSGAVYNAVSAKADKATTYTKDEVDAALAAKINASDVDASLSDTSTNPVQNRVIQAPLARLTESVESLSGIARAETFTTVANQYVYTNQSFTVPAGKVAIFTASVFYNDSKPNALKVGKNADPEATDEDAILWFHEVGEVSLGALSVSGITQKRNTNIIYYIHAKYTGAGTNAVSLYYRII